jgi:hypothetical protein
MMIFAFGIKDPFDVTVQRLHDPDPRHHGRTASRRQQQDFDRRLPFRQVGFLFRRAELVTREQLKWYEDKADNSPWLHALAELRQWATAINTSRRSPLRSTSTQRKRWASAATFSTSPTASASCPAPRENGGGKKTVTTKAG